MQISAYRPPALQSFWIKGWAALCLLEVQGSMAEETGCLNVHMWCCCPRVHPPPPRVSRCHRSGSGCQTAPLGIFRTCGLLGSWLKPWFQKMGDVQLRNWFSGMFTALEIVFSCTFCIVLLTQIPREEPANSGSSVNSAEIINSWQVTVLLKSAWTFLRLRPVWNQERATQRIKYRFGGAEA